MQWKTIRRKFSTNADKLFIFLRIGSVFPVKEFSLLQLNT